ncbi:NUDIX hydrolase [Desertihabitans aurantiacus]|uniref:NUDIX hydrolase n=1 Tax=Desertihabitans aurantiacus TaxID=2282477 RepID=UPI0018E555E8|nr:NUDIX domain-containing protein [Desertihabitans aurantiacus]
MTRSMRVSAYGVCTRAGALLLVHQVAPGPAAGLWTLPGGGLEFGEHPSDAVVRELREETGLTARVEELLAVHDDVYDLGDGVLRHGVRLLFAASVSGDPRPTQVDEVDQVGWHRLDSLPTGTTAWARLGAQLAASVLGAPR